MPYCTPLRIGSPIVTQEERNMADERKVALVTGSALNIGRAIALALAKDGFRIMTTARA